MAKKNTSVSYSVLSKNIREGKFYPLYFLYGEEDYYIDRIVKLIDENLLSEEEKDFNSYTYWGMDTDMGKVISTAQQYPVMASRQLIMLREAQSLLNTKSQIEKLYSYLKRPNKSTVLVITYKNDSLPKDTGLNKLLEDSTEFILFKSEKLRDYKLPEVIADYCNEKKLLIDQKAITLLCDYIGNPLSKLFGEIDKLMISIGGKGRITADLIENHIGISKDFNTYELVNALSLKDYQKAMLIVDYFARNPKQAPLVMVIATLFNYYSKLLIAKSLKTDNQNLLISAIDLKSAYAFKDYSNGLRNYSFSALLKIIDGLRQLDSKSKGIGSNQNEFELLKEFIFLVFVAK